MVKFSSSYVIYIVTNRLSLGQRKQARNENNKKYIYIIARMSQGSIKKRGELSVNHSRISDKYSQNQHNTIWRFNNKIYYNINNLIREK